MNKTRLGISVQSKVFCIVLPESIYRAGLFNWQMGKDRGVIFFTEYQDGLILSPTGKGPVFTTFKYLYRNGRDISARFDLWGEQVRNLHESYLSLNKEQGVNHAY